MAGRQVGFHWKSDTLRPNVRGFDARAERAITAAIEYGATTGERYMKTNARWTDQTGNARAGLHTSTEHTPRVHRIIFAHAVHYGIWLETRWSGRYQIIVPAVQRTGIQVMGLLQKLFGGLGGGGAK